jgi:hypothetical protein
VTPKSLLLAAIAAGAGGCGDCRPGAAADAPPSAAATASVELPSAPLPSAPSFRSQDDPRGYGLPAGCELKLPIHHAALPGARARFSAARGELDELAIAVAAADSATAQAGVIALSNRRVRALPWFELDRPPAFDRASDGWVAAFTRPSETGKASALLWSEHHPLRTLASGDQLAVADVACRGRSCAVLTTLPRAAAVPGAALHVIAPDRPPTRVELEADPGMPWQPLAITAFDGAVARVALRAPDSVALWSVVDGRATLVQTIATPFGAYDAATGKETWVAAPGARADVPCKEDEFPIHVHAATGAPHVLRGQAAPESLLLRPLERGALMLWVAPVSCSNAARTVVYGALLGAGGAPLGSATAIADAVGFAAATRGDELSLWLRTSDGLSLLRARCATQAQPPQVNPPSPTPAPPAPRSKGR